MALRDWTTHIHPVTGTATLAGWGAGHTVRFLGIRRLLRLLPSRRGPQAPGAFADILRQAILTEVQKAGIQLSDQEIDELVAKVTKLLEEVLSGKLSIDAIPSVAELLRSGGVLGAYLVPLIRGDQGLSDSKKEMLKRIFEENVRLRQAAVAAKPQS